MARILILGVNPFEDLPGFQLLGLLHRTGCEVIGADDSEAAAAALGDWGAAIRQIPHPSEGFQAHADAVSSVVKREGIDLIIAGSDAHLAGLTSRPGQVHGLPSLLGPGEPKLVGPFNKDSIHAALTAVLSMPRTMAFENAGDSAAWTESGGSYPVMVKGRLKGAIECVDAIEAHGAHRTILKNPANRCDAGGVVFQEYVAGTEHATLVFKRPSEDGIIGYIGVRKLARTQLGTTLCARTEDGADHAMIAKMASSVKGFPSVFEVEWRRRPDGTIIVFEVNLRFPSWIAALGDVAAKLLSDWVDNAIFPAKHEPPAVTFPAGQLVYRLPAGGPVPLDEAFCATNGRENGASSLPVAPVGQSKIDVGALPNSGTRLGPLWTSMSPHQFLVK